MIETSKGALTFGDIIETRAYSGSHWNEDLTKCREFRILPMFRELRVAL